MHYNVKKSTIAIFKEHVMDFISGAGATNVDLLYQGFDRLAGVGEELYCKDFSLQLGGGLPATLINLGRLGIDTPNFPQTFFQNLQRQNLKKTMSHRQTFIPAIKFH